MSALLRNKPRWMTRCLRAGGGLAFLFVLALHGVGCVVMPKETRLAAQAKMSLLETNGFSIPYQFLAAPDAAWNVVFIHGTPANAGVWHEQFAHPFPGANLCAYDRPGFAGAGPVLRDPHLATQVAALTNLLAVLPPRPVVLVAHSYGGPVALLAALERPDLVAGAVLIGGSIDPSQEHPVWIEYPFHSVLTSWVLPSWLRQCNRELLTLKDDLAEMKPRVPTLSVPVVMLHGERDRQVPVANVAFLRAELALAGKTNLFGELVFPEYTHFIPWEHPDAVASALAAVTDRIGRATPRRGSN
jgi:pimeloyl-ACP methyl ester carboxylesterase